MRIRPTRNRRRTRGRRLSLLVLKTKEEKEAVYILQEQHRVSMCRKMDEDKDVRQPTKDTSLNI